MQALRTVVGVNSPKPTTKTPYATVDRLGAAEAVWSTEDHE